MWYDVRMKTRQAKVISLKEVDSASRKPDWMRAIGILKGSRVSKVRKEIKEARRAWEKRLKQWEDRSHAS